MSALFWVCFSYFRSDFSWPWMQKLITKNVFLPILSHPLCRWKAQEALHQTWNCLEFQELQSLAGKNDSPTGEQSSVLETIHTGHAEDHLGGIGLVLLEQSELADLHPLIWSPCIILEFVCLLIWQHFILNRRGWLTTYYAAQVGLQLSGPSASASLSVGIKGISNNTWLWGCLIMQISCV